MFGLIRVKRFNELKERWDKIQDDLIKADKIFVKNKELSEEISRLSEKLTINKKQVREQTEADLFFVSAKIQKKLLEGEKKENLQAAIGLFLSYQNALEQTHKPNAYSLLESLGVLGRI